LFWENRPGAPITDAHHPFDHFIIVIGDCGVRRVLVYPFAPFFLLEVDVEIGAIKGTAVFGVYMAGHGNGAGLTVINSTHRGIGCRGGWRGLDYPAPGEFVESPVDAAFVFWASAPVYFVLFFILSKDSVVAGFTIKGIFALMAQKIVCPAVAEECIALV